MPPKRRRSIVTAMDKLPTSSYTAILEREGELYVALCLEIDVTSQGATVEEATANLKEAVELSRVRRPPGDCRAPARRRLRVEGHSLRSCRSAVSSSEALPEGISGGRRG
jgi:hypothetical protein